jgi:murein DD-endopeptidase MepM/ murein hydrolase activator NlpD
MRSNLLLCVTLVVALWPSPAVPQDAPARTLSQPPLSQPVVEVAVFQVAPVAAGGADSRARRNAASGGAPAAATATAAERVAEVRTQKGERWQDVLARLAAALSIRLPAAAAERRYDGLPQLQPGKYLRARMPTEGEMELDYVISADEAYGLSINATAMQVRALPGDPRLIERMRADPSKASLFTATDAVGLPENIALQLTELFAGEVDFLRELHLGYRCAIVYEAHYREGFIEPSGRILAAELEIGKRRYGAYFALDTQGRGAYFDSNGKHTRRLFRRSPLEFTRITSDYTLARFHPILGVWTAHRGVDYAAPTGTRIMSVADGVVEFAGLRGGYGNLVIIRHQEKFQSYYAHMNAFAPKLAPGTRVAQGETIGFVGMTGLATGPHLHFEFHVRNAAGEWNSVPAPDVIDTTLTAAPGFARKVQAYRASLAVAGNGNLLILE